MLKVYSCITGHHDLRLVALAAFVCLIGAVTTGILVQHVAISRGRSKSNWLLTAAIAAGLSIWATHFIAMLAFDPSLPHGYAIEPTALSMVLVLVAIWLAMFLGLRSRNTIDKVIAGCVMGLGVVLMHYVGMAGFKVVGRLIWDLPTILASAVVSAVFGAITVLCLFGNRRLRNFGAPIAFVSSVCGGHFVGMAALVIVPDPRVVLPSGLLDSTRLVGALMDISVLICALGVAAAVVSLRDRTRARREQIRFRNLTDVAVEGLVVCEGETILTTNESFNALMGGDRGAFNGLSIADLMEDPTVFRQPLGAAQFKARLRPFSGAPIPAEIIRREIEYAGATRSIYAVRDLRSQERVAAELEFLASHDTLTGLANRLRFKTLLAERFEAGLETGRGFGVLAIDLDRFKAINDGLGHAMGDTLLVKVANRLNVTTRGRNVVARLGGDEFAILLDSNDDPCAATSLADTIVDLLSRPFVIDGNVLEIGASIGIAFAPADAGDADLLMVRADLALYRAKTDGRGTYRVFEPHMSASMQERRTLEMDLRRATVRQEFELHYQPQLGTVSGEIVGFEALIRWRHPERGLVSPDAFIPIAEDMGLILNIGEWVIQTACAEAASWDRPLSIAVNLSPLQCRSAKIVEVVSDALRDSGLPSSRLELEITEGVLLNDNALTLTLLNALRALGVRISMDDFGTGYSSLSYLRSFPFDKIKIDRSFVSQALEDKEAASIVRAIIGLGISLGMSITAEGVETEEQLAFVRAHGCDEVQGFLISKPLEAVSIKPFLAAQLPRLGRPALKVV